jgi:hypothetical protein
VVEFMYVEGWMRLPVVSATSVPRWRVESL